MDDISLYESTICRLCAENNSNGVNLFTENEEDPALSIFINRFLPLKMEGLEKPRRKRGRPPKIHVDDIKEEVLETSQEDEDKQDEYDDELDGDGRRRRKRKIPKRFSEVVRGKELERIFKEEGVIDDEEYTRDHELDDKDKHLPLPDGNVEVIGHTESHDGEDLGELIIMNRGRGRGRPKTRHKKAKHICNTCGRAFQQRHRYIMHKSSHLGDKYECLECSKQFTILNNFLGHQKAEEHTGKRIIKNNCTNEEYLQDFTESIDDSADALESDNNDNNKDMKNMKIQSLDEDIKDDLDENSNGPNDNDNDDDNKNGNNNDNVNVNDNDGNIYDEFKDNELKDAKEYMCDNCEEIFTNLDTLEAHIKKFHNKDNPFVCEVCEETFASEENLKVHVSSQHFTNPKKTNKACVCDICGKVLNHPSSVVYHKEAEHNNGRKFVCNKCGKNFKHKQLLQRHQLTHSQARPFVCKLCDASFKTKANLINHQSTHTGEKKYRCTQCDRQFAHKTTVQTGQVWQIYPAQEAEDSIELQQVIAEEGAEENQPVIYQVSYQDPNDPSQSRTLQLSTIEGKELLSSLQVQEQLIKPNSSQEEIDFSDQRFLQITDAEGNPITLTYHEAKQLITHSGFGQHNGQIIRVPSEVPEEIPNQLAIHMRQTLAEGVTQQNIALDDNSALVKVLEDDSAEQIDGAATGTTYIHVPTTAHFYTS
ncbi:hypothetical protein G9C98_005186, partial [Cotesia typhae]